MARTVLLFSGPWTDLPLDDVASHAADWGYQGLELACWGDHIEVQRALSDESYCPARLDLLSGFDLQAPVISNHRVGHAVCARIDERHQSLVPEYVWGDGHPEGVQQRAAEEMIATIRVAQKLGATVVAGFAGSSVWDSVIGWPTGSPQVIVEGMHTFARRWNPILDVCADTGLRFALEVCPGQIAFDLQSAEATLDALHGHEQFGFLFDASNLYWHGVEPVEFLHRFSSRIFHVHIKDVALSLNGRNSILNSCLAPGDPRRGWDFRSPGHGGLDWEGIIRALNSIGYDGPLSVDWNDAGMERSFGAADACEFVKRLDFAAPQTPERSSFQ